MSIKTIEKNKLGNRTEELISILRDTHHMKICEGKNGIFCDDGRLMGFPVKIRILPQFGRASIFVYLGCSTIMKMEIMYMIDVPLEILLNNAVGRFEKELNQLKQ
ncbi:hypothetical protein [Bacteroides sp.]|uniref:hypothetical protein n=1 Tax=Bacteroides sp. TaxID=29523 RepID=UPI002FC7FACF